MEWERAEIRFSGVGWAGHCNGWAAAAILEPEPVEDRVMNGITFTVADQKGLLTSYHFADAAAWAVGSEDVDVAPADFHRQVTRWIGGERKAAVFTFRPVGRGDLELPGLQVRDRDRPRPARSRPLARSDGRLAGRQRGAGRFRRRAAVARPGRQSARVHAARERSAQPDRRRLEPSDQRQLRPPVHGLVPRSVQPQHRPAARRAPRSTTLCCAASRPASSRSRCSIRASRPPRADPAEEVTPAMLLGEAKSLTRAWVEEHAPGLAGYHGSFMTGSAIWRSDRRRAPANLGHRRATGAGRAVAAGQARQDSPPGRPPRRELSVVARGSVARGRAG